MRSKMFCVVTVAFLAAALSSCGQNSDDKFAQHCMFVVEAEFLPGYKIYDVQMSEVQRYVPTAHPDVLIVEIQYSHREPKLRYRPPGMQQRLPSFLRCGYSITGSKQTTVRDLQLVYFATATPDTYNSEEWWEWRTDIYNDKLRRWFEAHPQK